MLRRLEYKRLVSLTRWLRHNCCDNWANLWSRFWHAISQTIYEKFTFFETPKTWYSLRLCVFEDCKVEKGLTCSANKISAKLIRLSMQWRIQTFWKGEMEDIVSAPSYCKCTQWTVRVYFIQETGTYWKKANEEGAPLPLNLPLVLFRRFADSAAQHCLPTLWYEIRFVLCCDILFSYHLICLRLSCYWRCGLSVQWDRRAVSMQSYVELTRRLQCSRLFRSSDHWFV